MKNKLQNLITKSRKERDYAALSTYQIILASIQEREARENVSLSDDQILGVIEKEKKLFEESAEKNPRESASHMIKAQLCADLLPEQIDESEYDNIVSVSFQETGAESMRDMGNVIKHIKEKYEKTLDMGKISAMVKEKLNNK